MCFSDVFKETRTSLRTEGLFFGAFFLAHLCFRAGKKERSDAYLEKAGPQAPKGVLGCNSMSPKRGAGLQNPKPQKGCWGAKTLSPKKSVGVQNPKPQKECWVAKP